MKTLFFSRGRGRGHAIPDMAIAEDLRRECPDVNVTFISYATGAQTIRDRGYDVIDLEMAENNAFVETFVRAVRTIRDQAPALVISHEEFCVLPAAKVWNLPCVLLTDWFPEADSPMMASLSYADSVLFMDDGGIYDEPELMKEKIEYVGPFVRELRAKRVDRDTYRDALDIPPDRALILIVPGGSSTSLEANTPTFDLVLNAIDQLSNRPIVMWVVPHSERDSLVQRVPKGSNVVFIDPHPEIEKMMIAADLVITKATRKTSFELNALGVPSISISHGLNPVDDYRVAQISTNRALRARGLDASTLSFHIAQVLQNPLSYPSLEGTDRSRNAIVLAIRRFSEAIRLKG